jgi:hypothetical protein
VVSDNQTGAGQLRRKVQMQGADRIEKAVSAELLVASLPVVHIEALEPAINQGGR